MRNIFHSGAVRCRLVAAMMVTGLTLSACDEAINLTPNAVRPDDPCGQYRATISQARTRDLQQQAGGAAIGAAAGAVMGGLLSAGGNSTQRTGAVLAGAMAGGLAGYSLTYYNQVRDRTEDANALLATVNSDAQGERQVVTQAGGAAASLRQCRSQQVTTLTREVRGGEVETDTARSRLRQIQGDVQSDNEVISAAFNGVGERVDAYVDATNAVAEANAQISQREAQRQARNVARVQQETRTTVSRDSQDQERLSAQIEALDVLLS